MNRVDDSKLGEGLGEPLVFESFTVDESSSPFGQSLCCNWETPAGSPDSADDSGWKRPLADDFEALDSVARDRIVPAPFEDPWGIASF